VTSDNNWNLSRDASDLRITTGSHKVPISIDHLLNLEDREIVRSSGASEEFAEWIGISTRLISGTLQFPK
jgi:hypothetical protein